MYKGGKKRHLAAASWVDERARAGAGEAMVISLVPRPHPQKEGKGLAHFEPFLVFPSK